MTDTDMDAEQVDNTQPRSPRPPRRHRAWWVAGIIVLGTGAALRWPEAVRSPVHPKWFLMLPKQGVVMYFGRNLGLYSVDALVLPGTDHPAISRHGAGAKVTVGKNEVKPQIGAFGFRFGDPMPGTAGVGKWRALYVSSAFGMDAVFFRSGDQWLTVAGTSRGIFNVNACKVPFDLMGHRFTPAMSLREVKRNLAGVKLKVADISRTERRKGMPPLLYAVVHGILFGLIAGVAFKASKHFGRQNGPGQVVIGIAAAMVATALFYGACTWLRGSTVAFMESRVMGGGWSAWMSYQWHLLISSWMRRRYIVPVGNWRLQIPQDALVPYQAALLALSYSIGATVAARQKKSGPVLVVLIMLAALLTLFVVPLEQVVAPLRDVIPVAQTHRSLAVDSFAAILAFMWAQGASAPERVQSE